MRQKPGAKATRFFTPLRCVQNDMWLDGEWAVSESRLRGSQVRVEEWAPDFAGVGKGDRGWRRGPEVGKGRGRERRGAVDGEGVKP